MIDKDKLVIGERYWCEANDIVSGWQVALVWLGDGWSHDTENFEGYYPPIVDGAIHLL